MSAKQSEVMVIEVVDRRKSNWVLDGTEGTGLPQNIDTSRDKMIKATSVVKVLIPKKDLKEGGPTYTLRKIRYIKGCPTIFVDEQEKMGSKPNPAVDRADLVIEHGTKIVVRNGGTISLFDYFRNYEGNVDNPLRPDGAVDVYGEIKSVQISEDSLELSDARFEAETYLRSLRKKENGKETTYKEKELDFLCSLFKVPHLNSYSEKFVALLNIAHATPELFNDSIVDLKSGLISEVNMAKRLGVIKIDANAVLLVKHDKVLLNLKTSKEDDQVEELALFFLTPDGELPYKQFSIELRAAKEQAVAVQ